MPQKKAENVRWAYMRPLVVQKGEQHIRRLSVKASIAENFATASPRLARVLP
jgi:hypothetical protein